MKKEITQLLKKLGFTVAHYTHFTRSGNVFVMVDAKINGRIITFSDKYLKGDDNSKQELLEKIEKLIKKHKTD
jgi:hypothetical protein